MNKKIFASVFVTIYIIIVIGFFSGCDINWLNNNPESRRATRNYNNIIAHAGGGLDGLTYLNSIECIYENYTEGTLLYEFDFLMSSDGDLIGVHAWESWAVGEGYSFSNRMSLEEYINTQIRGNYMGLTFTNLLYLLQTDYYIDITIIIDTKEPDKRVFYEQLIAEASAVDINLLDRIIPYVYSPDMYDMLEEMYSFPAYMYAIYQVDASNQDVYEFMSAHEKVRALAVGNSRANSMSKSYIESLYNLGRRVFVHTIDSFQTMDSFREKGIDGFISNFI